MAPLPYNLDELAAAEIAFAEAHGVSILALKDTHRLRARLGTDLPSVGLRAAAWIVAPVMAGFTGWIAQHHAAAGNGICLGVMREGRMLCRLLRELAGIDAREIALNRDLAMRAAFGCGDEEALLNWLVRTRTQPLTLGNASTRLLGKSPPADADRVLDLDGARSLLEEWRKSGNLALAQRRAAALVERLLRHWKRVIGDKQDNAPVVLADFACAGNIQRSLHSVLEARSLVRPVIGANFVTTAGSRWAEQAGCVLHGYLAERGAPAWFADAYARTPELMELFMAAPLGALDDYADDGDPVFGACFLEKGRQDLLRALQDCLVGAARFYDREMGDIEPGIVRCIWGRFLLHPLPAEVEAFADWPLDAGLDGAPRRALAPRLDGDPSRWGKMQTAWPAGSARRI